MTFLCVTQLPQGTAIPLSAHVQMAGKATRPRRVSEERLQCAGALSPNARWLASRGEVAQVS